MKKMFYEFSDTYPKIIHRILAGLLFFTTLLIYSATVQTSVSFWDCGEFIASAYYLQVPHPPGAPLYLFFSKLFSWLPIGDNIALRINLLSAFTAALTILFLYLVIVKIIKIFLLPASKNFTENLYTYLSSAIGSLSLAFAYTFWSNAIEAEVYAFAVFLIVFIFWILLIWYEKSEEPDNERYLILTGYILGLSTGVSLLTILIIVPLTLMILFRMNNLPEKQLKESALLFFIHSIIIILVSFIIWFLENGKIPPLPEESRSFDYRFMMINLGVSLIIFAIFRKKIFNKGSLYFLILIASVAFIIVYPGIIKLLPLLVNKISGKDVFTGLILVIFLMTGVFYLVYWSSIINKPGLNLISKLFLFFLIGYSTIISIPVRSQSNPPINLISSGSVNGVLSYINREQYGADPVFKTRYSEEPNQTEIYKKYSNDLEFLLEYQMNHMFNRYLFWNFAGRSDNTNEITPDYFKFYMLPVLFGIIGLIYTWRKNWKIALILTLMFIFLGYLQAFFHNNQEPQPRERDYFYAGAFLVFAVWIAVGVKAFTIFISNKFNKVNKSALVFITLTLILILVPVNMLATNYKNIDRSENTLPRDYAYNLLQSTEKNAVLFTNGDNDTYPLWYLQNVESIRRDVRIIPLNLLNLGWFVKQLKQRKVFDAEKINLSLSDYNLDNLSLTEWSHDSISVYINNTAPDTNKEGNKISWLMPATVLMGGMGFIRPQDLVVKDIITSNINNRPIYFSSSCTREQIIGLDNYLRMEGLALKLVKDKNPQADYSINAGLTKKMLFNRPDHFSPTPHPAFIFSGINNKKLVLDQYHNQLVNQYRYIFLRLAAYYLKEKQQQAEASEVLKVMEQRIPSALRELPNELKYYYGMILKDAGSAGKGDILLKSFEEYHLNEIKSSENKYGINENYFILLKLYEDTKQYKKAVHILYRLKELIPSDSSLENSIKRMNELIKSDNQN